MLEAGLVSAFVIQRKHFSTHICSHNYRVHKDRTERNLRNDMPRTQNGGVCTLSWMNKRSLSQAVCRKQVNRFKQKNIPQPSVASKTEGKR